MEYDKKRVMKWALGFAYLLRPSMRGTNTSMQQAKLLSCSTKRKFMSGIQKHLYLYIQLVASSTIIYKHIKIEFTKLDSTYKSPREQNHYNNREA